MKIFGCILLIFSLNSVNASVILDTASHQRTGDYTLTTIIEGRDPLGQSFILDKSYNNFQVGGHYINSNPQLVNQEYNIFLSLVQGAGTDGKLIATQTVNLPDGFSGLMMTDFSSIGTLEKGVYTVLFSGGGSSRAGLGSTSINDPFSDSFDEFGLFPFTRDNVDFMVRVTGDVVPTVVPVPNAILLFASSLIGLFGMSKRQLLVKTASS